MSIIGKKLPDHEFHRVGKTLDIEKISTRRIEKGTNVIVGVPGAFTPKCTQTHLPSFIEGAAAFEKKQIPVYVCSVNDHWVMHNWLTSMGGESLIALSDWDAGFVRQLGLAVDFSDYGMGVRSKRFAMIVKSGVIADLFVDDDGSVDQTLAHNLIDKV